MPFSGNDWDQSKLVKQNEIMKLVTDHYDTKNVLKLDNEKNFTSRDYKISDYKGQFGIISSVSNPFCDGCNRIRLTANGQIKNCLFSSKESDLLTPLRNGKSITTIIQKTVQSKLKIRSGMDTLDKFKKVDQHNNRSMITIGG